MVSWLWALITQITLTQQLNKVFFQPVMKKRLSNYSTTAFFMATQRHLFYISPSFSLQIKQKMAKNSHLKQKKALQTVGLQRFFYFLF